MTHTLISYALILGLFIVFFISCSKRKDEVNGDNIGRGYRISASISKGLKGVCSICLICTHWCTYNLHLIEENAFTRFIPFHFGHFVIIIFMFLSGYGMATVEAKPRRFLDYCKNRIWKLLRPAWIVALLTLIVYTLWGPKNISVETVQENWLNSYMLQISHREFSLLFFVKYFILRLDWYVMTTLWLYLMLWGAVHFAKGKMQRILFLCIFVLLFYAVGRMLHFPAHYYRNLWSFPLGALCAVYPHWARNKIIVTIVSVGVGLNSFVEGLNYTVAALMALAVLMYVGYIFRRKELDSPFLLYLGSISYAVYLIHRTVYNMLWTYHFLYIPLFIIVTIILAHLFTRFVFQRNIIKS